MERGKRHAVRNAVRVVSSVLAHGDLVAVFPEGKTSDGTTVLPFHANLIQAAVDAGVPVLPAALRYFERTGAGAERRTNAATYIGETSIFQSLKEILTHRPLVAELVFLDPIDTTGLTRHQIANKGRAAIAGALEIEIVPV